MAIDDTDPDLDALRTLATDIATEAGEVLLDALHGARSDVSTKSTGTDMVSEMDRASEELIVSRIAAARPRDTIVGEEGADREGSTAVRWVIDPLDGTTNYLYRLPGWNVSVGVEVDGVPSVGAVVVPTHGETFSAATGRGATRNGVPLHLPERTPPLREVLVGTGFSYDPDVRARQAGFLVDVIPRVRDIRRGGAAATDLCAVAAGRLDAYYESGLAPWDWCAGTVIAGEAGAVVQMTEDHPLPGVLTVAAHPDGLVPFLGLLRDAGIMP